MGEEETIVRARKIEDLQIRHMAGLRFTLIQAVWIGAVISVSVGLSYFLVVEIRLMVLSIVTASSGGVSAHFLDAVTPVSCVALWFCLGLGIAWGLKWIFTEPPRENSVAVIWYRNWRTDLEIRGKALIPLRRWVFKVGHIGLARRRMSFTDIVAPPNSDTIKISMLIDFRVNRELKWNFVRNGWQSGVEKEIACLIRDRLIQLAYSLKDKPLDVSDAAKRVGYLVKEIEASHLGVVIGGAHNVLIQVIGQRRYTNNLFLMPTNVTAE